MSTDKIIVIFNKIWYTLKQIFTFIFGFFSGVKYQKKKQEEQEIKLTEERKELIKASLKRIKARKVEREEKFKEVGYSSDDDTTDPELSK